MARVKTRPYHSARRREQAQQTREKILRSARRLFVTRGYGASTLEALAQHAGTAVQTVYAVFGSKRGILFALLDQMAADADLPRLRGALEAASDDPRRQLRELIAFNGRFYRSGIDLIEIARTVSGVEPDLAQMWQEGESRRHRAQAALIEQWARAGWLATASVEQATDLLWALSGPDVFRLLTIERRWSRRRFETWLTTQLEGALLQVAPTGA
jgi:AcrR family transcriptional regulator